MTDERTIDATRTALLVIDMLNHFANEGDDEFRERFDRAAEQIASLKKSLSGHGAEVIYVNTAFRSQRQFNRSPMGRAGAPQLITGTPESEVVPFLQPDRKELIVEKTTYSAFYSTPLDAVLRRHGIRTLILTGVHTHVCVLLTAADAFSRGYAVLVPEECVTTMEPERHEFAIGYINRHLGATLSGAEVLAAVGRQ